MRPWSPDNVSKRATERATSDGIIYQPYHNEDSVLRCSGPEHISNTLRQTNVSNSLELHHLWRISQMCRLCLAIELDVDEDRVSNFGAIDNGAAANTNDLASAESELHLHTTTLDVIASLCNCMYGLWAESHSDQFPDARVEPGVEDEASEFRFKPTAKEDARVLVVAAIQPDVRAMRHGEVLVRLSGVGLVGRELQQRCRSYSPHCAALVLYSCLSFLRRRHHPVRAVRGNVAEPKTATGNSRIAYIGVILVFTHILPKKDLEFPPQPLLGPSTKPFLKVEQPLPSWTNSDS